MSVKFELLVYIVCIVMLFFSLQVYAADDSVQCGLHLDASNKLVGVSNENCGKKYFCEVVDKYVNDVLVMEVTRCYRVSDGVLVSSNRYYFGGSGNPSIFSGRR